MSDLNQELIKLIQENTRVSIQLVLNQEGHKDLSLSLKASIKEVHESNEEMLTIISAYIKESDPKGYVAMISELNKLLSGPDYKLKELIYNIKQFEMVKKLRNFIIFMSVCMILLTITAAALSIAAFVIKFGG